MEKKRLMADPVISIITVVYNGAATLESSILSVIRQTYSNIEYIIIDGGSVDGSTEIIHKYESRIARWISEPDRGIYHAINKALSLASGDWLLVLGCDDLLADANTIGRMVKAFDRPGVIYYGNVYFIHEKVIYPGASMSRLRFAARNFPHQAVFYPKGVYKSHFYEEKYKLYADYVYNLKLYKGNNELFNYIPVVVANYNDRGRSFATMDKDFVSDRLQLIGESLGWKYMIYILCRIPFGYAKRYLASLKF